MEQAKNIKIHLTRSASAADLKLSHVPKNELQVTIETLRSSNLYARMRGGDLSMTTSNNARLQGGRRTPPPMTTES